MGADADFVGRMAAQLELLLPALDEKSRRLVLGAVANAAGAGGVGAVARATGASWQTVADGAAELASGDVAPPGRARRPGGGRKRLEDHDPALRAELLGVVEDSSRGDPMTLLLWTTPSVRGIAAELTRRGRPCGPGKALRMLHAEGCSAQGNSRAIEGRRHPDRDAQFRYIDAAAREHAATGDPVISVDTKKKEQVGPYANPGGSWRPAGKPVPVRDHDFPDPQAGKAAPYGIYDIADNSGFVNVGTDHDTAAFAVESIRRWRRACGRDRHPGARRLPITADAGGSNGYRARAWKAGLAEFAAETGPEITVLHFPPGTSKWNKIEHRLFAQITRTWRARPLTGHQVILSTIAATTTSTGLKVTAVPDPGRHPLGAAVSDERMNDLQARFIARHDFHGDWNYTISPEPSGPAPQPGPAPAPRRPAPDLAALDQPVLTGLPPGAAAALAVGLAAPHAVRREARLHARRGRGRRASARPPHDDPRSKMTLAGYIPAAILHLRFGLAASQIAPLLGCDRTTIGHDLPRTLQLLADTATIIPPAPVTLRTTRELRDYAAAAGITLPQPTIRQNTR